MSNVYSLPILREPVAPIRKTPIRPPNVALRSREHLTAAEVRDLIKAAKKNRHGHRDSTMIAICYRHGLRASELCNLKWDQVSFSRGGGVLHVRRLKSGTPSTHPLGASELRALRVLRRDAGDSAFVFTSERGGEPISTKGFAAMLVRAAEAAKLEIKAHPHMLRHSCGHVLANAGRDTRSIQAWLGHRNIQHTVRYTEMSPNRFRNFWPETT